MTDPSPAALSRRHLVGSGLALAALPGLAVAAPAADGSETLASIRQGRLSGRIESGVRVFRGVPYAKPPVGRLRFRAPEPAEAWSGVREATRFSAPPLQGGGGRPADAPAPDEDCLYANVWAPQGPGPFPVLVFCYGGGNNGGEGSLPVYDGTRFAQDGVVAVTFNYRVGALGWLELGPHIPSLAGSGANALKDIVALLSWVKENIAAFGGDPGRVTLGGVLAGSKNVMSLIACPAAKGLFHRAVTMSTSAHTTHTPAEADTVARLMIAAHTGRAEDLLSASPAEIMAAQRKVLVGYNRNSPFRTLIDGRFMPRPLHEAFRAGVGRDIPLMIGTTRDESASTLPRGAETKPFPIDQGELNSLPLSELNVLDLRYQRAFPAMSPLERRRKLVHAEEYWVSCLRVAEARAAHGASTWFYRSDRVLTSGRYVGFAPSGSDIPLVFDTLDRGEVVPTEAAITPDDRAAARIAHAALVAYVESGRPTAQGLPAWPSYSAERRETMLLGPRPALALDPLRDERLLWADVFP